MGIASFNGLKGESGGGRSYKDRTGKETGPGGFLLTLRGIFGMIKERIDAHRESKAGPKGPTKIDRLCLQNFPQRTPASSVTDHLEICLEMRFIWSYRTFGGC